MIDAIKNGLLTLILDILRLISVGLLEIAKMLVGAH